MFGKPTEKVPPKPQHCSPSPNSTRRTPRDRPKEERHRLPARGAAGVAGAVQGDRGLELARPRPDAQAVDDEVAELPGAPAERLDLGEIGLALELQRRPVEEHGGAGARGDDHRVGPGEGPDRVPDHPAGGGPVPAVEGRLAAAGLRLGKAHLAAQVLQHLDRRRGDVVVEGVAQAGRHQLHPAAGDRSPPEGKHQRGAARPAAGGDFGMAQMIPAPPPTASAETALGAPPALRAPPERGTGRAGGRTGSPAAAPRPRRRGPAAGARPRWSPPRPPGRPGNRPGLTAGRSPSRA